MKNYRVSDDFLSEYKSQMKSNSIEMHAFRDVLAGLLIMILVVLMVWASAIINEISESNHEKVQFIKIAMQQGE